MVVGMVALPSGSVSNLLGPAASENATQESITFPTRSVHHASFSWALYHPPIRGPKRCRLTLPRTREVLARSIGVEHLAPYRTKKRDPNPQRSAYLSRLRYRIDTVFSQLTGRNP